MHAHRSQRDRPREVVVPGRIDQKRQSELERDRRVGHEHQQPGVACQEPHRRGTEHVVGQHHGDGGASSQRAPASLNSPENT